MSTRNHEITSRQKVLNPDGSLREPGYSKRPCQIYSRDQIKAPKFRIKEWDYYLVTSNEYGIALTMADLGYIGMLSVSLLDFTIPWEHTETQIIPLPMGKMKMPESSTEGNSKYATKRVNMGSTTIPTADIICTFKNFHEGNLTARYTLTSLRPTPSSFLFRGRRTKGLLLQPQAQLHGSERSG